MSRDPFSLAGKTILITGASSGIGRATAIACSKRQATMIVSGRDQTRLDETLTLLEGPGHRAVTADLTDSGQRQTLVDHVGHIDGLFFSAGIAVSAPARLISEKHVKQLMSIDFEAPLLLAQRLLYKKLVRTGGTIVFNTSVAARNAPMGAAVYSAAKAGLFAAARSIALEVARDAIRVNCLQLGYVKTALLNQLDGAGVDVSQRDSISPLGLGEVEDAAHAAVFLLSDASRWISRTSLTVDGGIGIGISA